MRFNRFAGARGRRGAGAERRRLRRERRCRQPRRPTRAAVAPRRQRSPATSPAPARAPRTRRSRPGSPGSRTPTPTSRSPTTRSAPAAAASSSSRAASRTPARTRRSRTTSSPAPRSAAAARTTSSRSRSTSRRSRSSTTSTGVDDLQLSPDDAGEDLHAGDQELGRPGDQGRQPGRDAPGPAHHPGEPLGRVGHDAELHGLPASDRAGRLDRRGRAASGRSRAARPRRAPRASSTRQERQGHDRLRRREPGRRAGHRQDQGRRRVRRPDAEAAAKIVERLQGDRRPGQVRVHVHARPHDGRRERRYPIVLVSYAMACTKYDDAAQGALVKGYLQLHRSAPRARRPPPRTPARLRSATTLRTTDPAGRRRDRGGLSDRPEMPS